MATHSRILAWKIPWTEEPSRLQSMGSLRVGHDCAVGTLDWIVPCCGGSSYCRGVAAPGASTHWMPVAPLLLVVTIKNVDIAE